MAIKRAKILTESEIEQLIGVVSNSPIKESDRLKIYLTFYAGLRVSEVAKLRVDSMLNADGRIGTHINIFSDVGKNRRERTIPMHPIIKDALRDFLRRHPDEEFVALPQRVQHMTPNNLTMWFWSLYKKAGLQGCSSHSGRRTFITNLARSANQYNSSLKDVQLIAGHSRLDSTEAYIEPSDNVIDLVGSLGAPQSARRSNKRVEHRNDATPRPYMRKRA